MAFQLSLELLDLRLHGGKLLRNRRRYIWIWGGCGPAGCGLAGRAFVVGRSLGWRLMESGYCRLRTRLGLILRLRLTARHWNKDKHTSQGKEQSCKGQHPIEMNSHGHHTQTPAD
jgi:hypothetical protein